MASTAELTSNVLLQGWGLHISKWVLMVFLSENGAGISWPNGLGQAMKSVDPDHLLRKWDETYGPNESMRQRFENWLMAAHLVWGTPLPQSLKDEMNG